MAKEKQATRSFNVAKENKRYFINIFKKGESLKKHFIKSIKIALAAVVSIFLAMELGLESSATAGIITILCIQDTKRETLRTVFRRGAAYLLALGIAAGCFGLLGFSLGAFAVFLLLFAFVCMSIGLQEGIATAAVLILHFLNAGNMSGLLLLNESGLFLIGSGIGILVNLHLRKREADFEKLAQMVDEQMKDILKKLAQWLPNPNRVCDRADRFTALEEALSKAEVCAVTNWNNSFRCGDRYELDYIRMREKQAVVLKGIYANIMQIGYLPEQTNKVARYLEEVELAYHKYNTVEALLDKLHALEEEMKQDKLPVTREEFEARAILYYILLQLEELLWIKRRFVLERENDR